MDVFVIGSFSTAVGRMPDRSLKDLVREAVLGAARDADVNGNAIQSAWFSNGGMWVDGQAGIRGQVLVTPLIRDGLLPERLPIINVEGGCASGSIALQGACKDILSQSADISLALGAERMYYPDDPGKTQRLLNAGIDRYDPEEWQSYYEKAGKLSGRPFQLGEDRSLFMDTYSMQACFHMKTYGTTVEQIATAAAKNHTISQFNPRAQYRFPMSVEQVLADRPVSYPNTRAMCAPIGDGAAALIVCSHSYLASLPQAVRRRAIRVAGSALTSGIYREPAEPGLSSVAAARAYEQAGIGAQQIDVAEVHDATSFSELYQLEMLGFCPLGSSGEFTAAGETSLGGSIPVNLSGGLVSRGHPVGATGLMMLHDIAEQLRGEAGPRQVSGTRYGLVENGGGVIGFEEAACAVTILEGPSQ